MGMVTGKLFSLTLQSCTSYLHLVLSIMAKQLQLISPKQHGGYHGKGREEKEKQRKEEKMIHPLLDEQFRLPN